MAFNFDPSLGQGHKRSLLACQGKIEKLKLKSVKYKVSVDVYMDAHEEFVTEVTRIGVRTVVETKLREPLYLSVYGQVASKIEETLYEA